MPMTKTKIKQRETVERKATIRVTENLTPAMYLRRELATGSADDGTNIEVSTTGPHIIIMLGQWPHGRQFVLSISDLTTDILDAMTEAVAV